jgi:prepilin-type processing-associated H-X9-DG protein
MKRVVEHKTMKLNLLLCLFALLPTRLAIASPAARPPDMTATDVVQQFLAARSASNENKMQAMLAGVNPLIAGQRKHIKLEDYGFTLGATPAQIAVVSLLYDSKNKLGYRFTITGTDVDFPNIVIVRAEPTIGTPLALQVVVEPDSSAADALRVDDLLTVNCADPRVMLPIVERLRENGRRIVSQKHLQQLSMALMQYLQENDEKMPDATHWVDELMPYVLKDASIFHDPSALLSQKWGYAFNKNLSGQSFARVGAPENVIAFFESTSDVKNASDTGQSVPAPGRYANGSDFSFVDGHVKWFADGTKLSFLLSGK